MVNKKTTIYHANVINKEKSVERLRSSFKRHSISVQYIKNENPVESKVNLVLAEVYPKSTFVFSKEKWRKGTEITLMFKEPLEMAVRGMVAYCEEATGQSGLVGRGKAKNYRTLIQFIPQSDVEKKAVADLCLKIRNNDYVPTNWHKYRQTLQDDGKPKNPINTTAAKASGAVKDSAAPDNSLEKKAENKDMADTVNTKDKPKKVA